MPDLFSRHIWRMTYIRDFLYLRKKFLHFPLVPRANIKYWFQRHVQETWFSLSPNFKNSLKPNALWWGGAIVSLHFLQGVCLFLSPFLLSPSVTLSLIHCLTHRLMPHLFFSDHQTFGFHMICYNVMILLCSWFVFWKICCMQKFNCSKVMYTLQSFDQLLLSFVKNKESLRYGGNHNYIFTSCDCKQQYHGYQTVIVTDYRAICYEIIYAH